MQVTNLTGGDFLGEAAQILSNTLKPADKNAENSVKETASKEASKGLSSLVKGSIAAAAAVAAVVTGVAIYDRVQRKKKLQQEIDNLKKMPEPMLEDKRLQLLKETETIKENLFPKKFFIDNVHYDKVLDNKAEQNVKEPDIESIKREGSKRLANMIAKVDEFNQNAKSVKQYGIDLEELKTKVEDGTLDAKYASDVLGKFPGVVSQYNEKDNSVSIYAQTGLDDYEKLDEDFGKMTGMLFVSDLFKFVSEAAELDLSNVDPKKLSGLKHIGADLTLPEGFKYDTSMEVDMTEGYHNQHTKLTAKNCSVLNEESKKKALTFPYAMDDLNLEYTVQENWPDFGDTL